MSLKLDAKYGCDILAFTYTEPLTYYEFTYETAVLAKENGIKTVLVSAGYINEEPLKKLVPFIDAANIDLKSFDDKLYRRLNGASLQPVLNTLKTLHENGVWLEITNLLIPTLNDSEEMIGELCKWLVENGFERTPLHISRFFPTYKLTELPPTPTVSLLMARERAKEAGMKFVYVGNSPEIDGENTYCPTCKTLLIRRDGFVVKENNMAGNKCRNCGETINGIFQHQHSQ
jgi:Pyruvate-formate lyase-activating enzyme